MTGERTPTPSCTDGARRVWEDTTWCEEWIQKASLCCGAGSVRVMRVLSGTEADKLLQAREERHEVKVDDFHFLESLWTC